MGVESYRNISPGRQKTSLTDGEANWQLPRNGGCVCRVVLGRAFCLALMDGAV